MKERNYKMDNIRFVLIFLVVLGHITELFCTGGINTIYKVIYTFHIPCLIFITGFFAKFNPRKIAKRFVLPYLIFQVLYIAFDFYILKSKDNLLLQFTTPNWLLWYIFSSLSYFLIMPIIDTQNKKKAIVILIMSIFVSLLSGYDATIGYYLSLSRTFVFMPFFISGFYVSKFFDIYAIYKTITEHRFKIITTVIIIICILEFFIYKWSVPRSVLYGAYAYSSDNGNIGMRIIFLVCAFFWMLAFLSVIPNRCIKLITFIGQNSMPIYLIHGFIIKYMSVKNPFVYSQPINFIAAVAISAVIMLALGSKPIAAVFKKFK